MLCEGEAAVRDVSPKAVLISRNNSLYSLIRRKSILKGVPWKARYQHCQLDHRQQCHGSTDSEGVWSQQEYGSNEIERFY